jgi:hypothetical protein
MAGLYVKFHPQSHISHSHTVNLDTISLLHKTLCLIMPQFALHMQHDHYNNNTLHIPELQCTQIDRLANRVEPDLDIHAYGCMPVINNMRNIQLHIHSPLHCNSIECKGVEARQG